MGDVSDRFDLGAHKRAITTSSQEAQHWFNMGLNWCFGFNQEEGLKCFKKVLEFDPDCAMAHWGVAYAAGPFYNFPWCDFSPNEAQCCTKLCHTHSQRALELAGNATPFEKALTQALTARFQKPHPVSQEEFNRWDDDYADAMRKAYRADRSDHDIAALFAEGAMTRTPWKLWDVINDIPMAGADTLEALEACEHSIALSQKQGETPHPAILHLHIHALEMSHEPERAMASADTLNCLCPDVGHMNHMPGHIYVLCGEYEKAKLCSEKAIRADDMYLEYAGPYQFYTTACCHDLHLMMYACMFMGQFEAAKAAADKMCALLSEDVLSIPDRPQMAHTLEGYFSNAIDVLVRFGRWQEIVDTPLPNDRALYCVTVAMHHYAKGVAHAALKNFELAEDERRQFYEAVGRICPERKFFNNTAREVLAVGEEMLNGELEYHKGNYEVAYAHLRESVQRDDALSYSEPWPWMHPPRHALAALLAEQGHYEEAEDVYRTDLGLNKNLQRCAQHPGNVWALHGLVECLRRKGKSGELDALEDQLSVAVAKADIDITSSCMCRMQNLQGCCE
ncbi:MAG: tetratricopeptide repeat protein [Hyphomicrobiales bacterium]